MTYSAEILAKRIAKLKKQFQAFSDYKNLIDRMAEAKKIYDIDVYNALKVEEKAVFDAYLKRFSSVQDFLGAKVFPLMLEVSGIGTGKMTEVLEKIEKEEIIDSISRWIEIREARNSLEHEYPDLLEEALENLKFCVESFDTMKRYYDNSIAFSMKYLK